MVLGSEGGQFRMGGISKWPCRGLDGQDPPQGLSKMAINAAKQITPKGPYFDLGFTIIDTGAQDRT